MATTKKTLTTAQMRRMNRCCRSWPKTQPAFDQAAHEFHILNIFQCQMAASHFLGGCEEQLRMFGQIGRSEFIRLLTTATERGKNFKP